MSRRVAKDHTLQLHGRTYVVAPGNVRPRQRVKVILAPQTDALIDVRCDGTPVRCGLCDPVKSARRRRPQRLEEPKT